MTVQSIVHVNNYMYYDLKVVFACLRITVLSSPLYRFIQQHMTYKLFDVYMWSSWSTLTSVVSVTFYAACEAICYQVIQCPLDYSEIICTQIYQKCCLGIYQHFWIDIYEIFPCYVIGSEYTGWLGIMWPSRILNRIPQMHGLWNTSRWPIGNKRKNDGDGNGMGTVGANKPRPINYSIH